MHVATPAAIETKLQEMVRRIVERFDPERIILFGSHARGDATEDSDVATTTTETPAQGPEEAALARETRLGVERIVDLTNPADPKAIGTITGVASRTALGENNILYSTDRNFVKGNPSELNGVRTASLRRIAVVRNVGLMPVVAGQTGTVSGRDVDVDFAV